MLAFPDLSKPYILYTDASDSCIGTVLMQKHECGDVMVEKPVFYSVQLHDAQTQWSPVVKEAYAIYKSLLKLKPYIENCEVIVKSDHKPLKKYFMDTIQNTKIDCWSLTLQEFNLKFIWIAGAANKAADCLSQLYSPKEDQNNGDTPPETINMLTQEEQEESSVYKCESPTSAKSSTSSLSSKLHSMFVYLLLTCFRWWTSFKYTPSFSITCNFQQGGDGQCTYCDHELSEMDTFDHNLIWSIAVDSDNATDLLSSLQKATDMTLCLKSLKQDQKHDPQIQDIIEQLNSGKASRRMQAKYSITSDGLLHFNADIYGHVQPVIFLPQKYRQSVLTAMHDNLGHLGIHRTYHIIWQLYYWPQLYNDISRYCQQCKTCQQQMLHHEKQPMLSSSVPNYPFQKIAVDLVDQVNIQSYDGNQYILTCMDMLTLWVEAMPLKSKDTKLVGKLIIDHIICHFGCPEILLSDNGGEFCSKVIDEICTELSIKHIKTAPYAQANGKLENFHKLLISLIKKNVQHDA